MSSELSCDHSHRYGMTIPPCSGNGKCISGLCYCHAGWSGRADYQVDPHYDCDIYMNGVRIESSILALACIILIIVSIRSLSKMKLKYSDIGRDPKVTVLLCYVINGLADTVYALSKASDPYRYFIGSDNYLTTISSCIFIIFCGLGWCYFFIIFINFLKGYSKMVSSEYRDLVTSRCKQVNDYIYCSMIFPLLYIILDLLTATYPHKSDYFAIGTLMSIVSMMICYLIATQLTITAFVKEIGKYLLTVENNISNQITLDQISTIYYRIKTANQMITIFFIFTIVIGIIVSSISYLRRKVTYIQIFLRFCFTIVEIGMSFILTPVSKQPYLTNGRSIYKSSLTTSRITTPATTPAYKSLTNSKSNSSKIHIIDMINSETNNSINNNILDTQIKQKVKFLSNINQLQTI